ncbi:MAG: NAD(+) synthase [Dehalogenimonas sp.]
MDFHSGILSIDTRYITDKVCAFIQKQVNIRRLQGVVVGLSGGLDSALCASLCVKAVGAENVIGLILPERDSDPVSKKYALEQAAHLGIRTKVIDITQSIQSFGAYSQLIDALRAFFPRYDATWKFKIVLPGNLLNRDSYNFYTVFADDGQGNIQSARVTNKLLRQIVAANNCKQRTRMLYLYNIAEALDYLVCGTTNKSELIQGFFVKYGDGGVDIEPIAALYKSQVYELAKEMNVITEIIDRPPTPDTLGLATTDEEFYFRMPYQTLDLLLFAWENDVPIPTVCNVMGLSEDQVGRAFREIRSKYNITTHLRSLPPSMDFTIGELTSKRSMNSGD